MGRASDAVARDAMFYTEWHRERRRVIYVVWVATRENEVERV